MDIEIPYIEEAMPHIPIINTACKKQDEIDSIYQHLDEGNVRMTAIEKSMADYHKTAAEDRKRLEAKLDENSQATEESKKATDEILEIIQMGKGFFRSIAWTGKWLRRTVMWVVPPVAAIIGLWQALKPPK